MHLAHCASRTQRWRVVHVGPEKSGEHVTHFFLDAATGPLSFTQNDGQDQKERRGGCGQKLHHP